MKWLFSAHKASQRILNYQSYHLHEGSRTRFLHASNSIGWSQPYQKCNSSLYYGHYYGTSAILNATESSYRLSNSNKNENGDLEIISTETIKPSSPTPQHLRTYNFSIIDQYMWDVYSPMTWFFPNNSEASLTDAVTKRSKHLKETLSQILTRFYPLAGKIKDSLQIECNDEGVYYKEARVNQTLEDFLGDPDDDSVRGLLPESPCTAETSKGNYVLGIQVNIFKCGGIGLSASFSHKIFDGQTVYLFMKSWAAAARGSPTEIVSPSFVASEIFPNNPSLEYSVPSKVLASKPVTTKRFVFDSTALALLKTQPVANASSAQPPTRTEATAALIWKAAAQAASKVRPFGPQSPHVLLSVVNFRKRASPPLAKESIGNLVDAACSICFPAGQLDLPTLMGQIRESMAKINANHIENMKGEKGHETFNEILRGFNKLADMTEEGDCMLASSLLNNGMYELDFGWGKPIWFYSMCAGSASFVFLNDTLKGGGVEALVTLSPEQMEIFERDSELLSYTTVNPSPLRFVH